MYCIVLKKYLTISLNYLLISFAHVANKPHVIKRLSGAQMDMQKLVMRNMQKMPAHHLEPVEKIEKCPFIVMETNVVLISLSKVSALLLLGCLFSPSALTQLLRFFLSGICQVFWGQSEHFPHRLDLENSDRYAYQDLF